MCQKHVKTHIKKKWRKYFPLKYACSFQCFFLRYVNPALKWLIRLGQHSCFAPETASWLYISCVWYCSPVCHTTPLSQLNQYYLASVIFFILLSRSHLEQSVSSSWWFLSMTWQICFTINNRKIYSCIGKTNWQKKNGSHILITCSSSIHTV